MTSAIKSDRIILPTGIINGYVYFSDGKITAVTTEEMSCDILYDMTGDFVSPGFIDMHTHGGMGYDFIGDSDGIVKGCNFHLQHGTTSICPTVSAAPFGVMKKAVGEIGKAMKSPELKANIIGAHLEGPYLSKAQCGAQSTDFITPPVEEEYSLLISFAYLLQRLDESFAEGRSISEPELLSHINYKGIGKPYASEPLLKGNEGVYSLRSLIIAFK